MSAVSYAAVADLTLSLGAGGAWMAQCHPSARHHAVTTHGEWPDVSF
jgi:hypothetical protein